MSQATSLLMQLLSPTRPQTLLRLLFFPRGAAYCHIAYKYKVWLGNLERRNVFELVYVGSVPSITDGVISIAVLALKDCRDPSLRHRYVGAFTTEWHRLVEIRQN